MVNIHDITAAAYYDTLSLGQIRHILEKAKTSTYGRIYQYIVKELSEYSNNDVSGCYFRGKFMLYDANHIGYRVFRFYCGKRNHVWFLLRGEVDKSKTITFLQSIEDYLGNKIKLELKNYNKVKLTVVDKSIANDLVLNGLLRLKGY